MWSKCTEQHCPLSSGKERVSVSKAGGRRTERECCQRPRRGISRSRVWSAVSGHKGGERDEARTGLAEFLVTSARPVSVKW